MSAFHLWIWRRHSALPSARPPKRGTPVGQDRIAVKGPFLNAVKILKNFPHYAQNHRMREAPLPSFCSVVTCTRYGCPGLWSLSPVGTSSQTGNLLQISVRVRVCLLVHVLCEPKALLHFYTSVSLTQTINSSPKGKIRWENFDALDWSQLCYLTLHHKQGKHKKSKGS